MAKTMPAPLAFIPARMKLLTADYPVSEIVCGPPPALSAITIDPVSAPLTRGEKVIERSKPTPAATEPLQVFVCGKSPFGTVLEITNGPLPLFER